MNVKYFKDTDTAVLEVSKRPIEETRAISDNVSVDLDADGNLVSMTIEHAAAVGELPRVSVHEVDVGAA